jgi:hypothetical protein
VHSIVFGSKKDEGNRQFRMLHNEEIHDLYIIQCIQYSEISEAVMGWASGWDGKE